MSAEEVAQNEGASVERAAVPASGLSLPALVCDGDVLVDTLDIVVLIQVLYDTVSGRKVTPLETWRRLQDRGIRSTKNRKELVGKNSVYESYGRLIDAGYVERYEKPNEKLGRKGAIAYRVYDNPAWNPSWQAGQVGVEPLETGKSDFVKPQVGPLPGTGDPVSREVEPEDKTAGRDASRNWGSGVPGSGVPGSGKRVVPAGRNASPVPGSSKPSPPHPPEEVTTSSPYPLTDTTGHKPAPPEEEGRSFTPEQTTAASQLLQVLPQPWSLGRIKAKNLAPKLLESMTEQGWPQLLGINDRDRALLVQQLTKNPGRMNNSGSILERDRIPNLPLYEVVAASVTPSGASVDGKCPEHPQYRAGRHCIPCAMA